LPNFRKIDRSLSSFISNHGHIYIKSFFDNKFFEMTWWESRCWELHPKNEATLNPQVNVVVIRDWLMEKSFKTQDNKRTERKQTKIMHELALFFWNVLPSGEVKESVEGIYRNGRLHSDTQIIVICQHTQETGTLERSTFSPLIILDMAYII
jgi:hypothetical protein